MQVDAANLTRRSWFRPFSGAPAGEVLSRRLGRLRVAAERMSQDVAAGRVGRETAQSALDDMLMLHVLMKPLVWPAQNAASPAAHAVLTSDACSVVTRCIPFKGDPRMWALGLSRDPGQAPLPQAMPYVAGRRVDALVLLSGALGVSAGPVPPCHGHHPGCLVLSAASSDGSPQERYSAMSDALDCQVQAVAECVTALREEVDRFTRAARRAACLQV